LQRERRRRGAVLLAVDDVALVPGGPQGLLPGDRARSPRGQQQVIQRGARVVRGRRRGGINRLPQIRQGPGQEIGQVEQEEARALLHLALLRLGNRSPVGGLDVGRQRWVRLRLDEGAQRVHHPALHLAQGRVVFRQNRRQPRPGRERVAAGG